MPSGLDIAAGLGSALKESDISGFAQKELERRRKEKQRLGLEAMQGARETTMGLSGKELAVQLPEGASEAEVGARTYERGRRAEQKREHGRALALREASIRPAAGPKAQAAYDPGGFQQWAYDPMTGKRTSPDYEATKEFFRQIGIEASDADARRAFTFRPGEQFERWVSSLPKVEEAAAPLQPPTEPPTDSGIERLRGETADMSQEQIAAALQGMSDEDFANYGITRDDAYSAFGVAAAAAPAFGTKPRAASRRGTQQPPQSVAQRQQERSTALEKVRAAEARRGR